MNKVSLKRTSFQLHIGIYMKIVVTHSHESVVNKHGVEIFRFFLFSVVFCGYTHLPSFSHTPATIESEV